MAKNLKSITVDDRHHELVVFTIFLSFFLSTSKNWKSVTFDDRHHELVVFTIFLLLFFSQQQRTENLLPFMMDTMNW
jgi:hypothetical protein